MSELEFFKEHNRTLFSLYIFPLYQRLSETQLRSRPDPRLNSVAWNLWHMARAEDLGMNRLLTDGVQVLDEDNWFKRLDVPFRQIGTGMTKDDVDRLSAGINLPALQEYQQAVHARSAKIVSGLNASCLEQKLDAALLQRVLCNGQALHPDGKWVYDVYLNQTKGWLLLHLGVNHPYFHLGEGLAVLSLMTS